MTKLNHIFVPQLQIPTIRYAIAVQRGPIRTLQIDQVRLDTADPVAKLVALLGVAELNHGVLLADAGVLRRQVHDGRLPADQPAAPRAQVDRVHHVGALEDEELPLVARRRLARLGGLVVLERDARPVRLRHRVGRRCQHARVAPVGLFLGLCFLVGPVALGDDGE